MLSSTFISIVLFLCLLGYVSGQSDSQDIQRSQKTCVVQPSRNGSDDVPATIEAFKKCGTGGHVVFLNETYYMNSVMETVGLKDCQVDLYGTLLWSTNLTYWLNHSLHYDYQNQSSVWWFGGDNVQFRGHGYGTIDGNGQAWYDFVKGVSNYPNRPESFTIYETTNSVFSGLRFVQSQMWTMTVWKSAGILLQDIYVNSTSSDGNPARNTDGVDTIYSDNIHFDRWTVINGDDSISLKANSTNILITNCTFIRGLGVSLGSIGQYAGRYEIIENVTARDISYYNTLHAGYIKTWTGQQVGYPPNGGGGGLGYAKNIHFSNLTLHNTTQPFSISQCTTFSGVAGNCSSSLFAISDIVIDDVRGTILKDPIASWDCSASAPCRNIAMFDVDLTLATTGGPASGWNCTAVVGTTGFNCTGTGCGTGSATGSC
ncbi:hypothetical protein BP5796_02251 [Coleophoma crateriformis]|uniref:Glycoside hydrolase family 28 protein n=1 Tax=Coleophoma crateriformis TaxID=565419 RepID=A0A3D8SXQ3_9HELO|nr:hypothetical protein BP5796_02251 [Coleophoma crateriformis]